MTAKPFEKSPEDKEVKGKGKGKEGSKREEAFDRKQAKFPTKKK